ncbi:hypothetical protein MMC17_006562 [Xylographa soralifera]|nr:hypothetical protein [Xylographa soralifera]
MDPITAFGVAAAVAQFLELGFKVSERLAEYVNASPGETPRALEGVTTQLPLILKALSHIKSESHVANYDSDTRYILHGVVLGCLKLARELEQIAAKLTPKPGENLHIKLKKILGSLKSDERIVEIHRGLRAYVQVLILHQVVSRTEFEVSPPKNTKYYEVKEKRIMNPLPRKALMSRLHEVFHQAARSQKQNPELAVLYGEEGVGKSQLALEYCEESYQLGHYRAVFWIHASNPTTLKLGLQNAASTIWRSKAGSPEEKLDFLNKFLSQSWHPWLLVLDDYSPKDFETESLQGLLPKNGHGAVIIITRSSNTPEFEIVIKVYKALTPDEDTAVRYAVSKALREKKLDVIMNALSNGFNVNCYSTDMWNVHQPITNLAAKSGFVDAVRLFLEMGANPCLDKTQMSVLGAAVYSDEPMVVELCLDYEDTTGYHFEYDSPVYYAVSKGYHEILNMFLKRRSGEGFTEAAERGDLETIRLLQSYDKIPYSPRVRATALVKTIQKRNFETVKHLVLETRFNLDEFSEVGMGETALGAAVLFNGEDEGEDERKDGDAIISFLLDAGASPNQSNRLQKNAPLHQAAEKGLDSRIAILLKHGADPSLENKERQNALEYAALQYRTQEHIRDTTHSELALPAIQQADINHIEERTGNTPLLLAIKVDTVPIARMLVRNGARQDIADIKGRIPLLLAAEKGQHILIKDLVKAKDSRGLEACDKNGNTPLMIAVQQKHESSVSVLLDLGADPEAMNKFGETALNLAEEHGSKDIIQLLQIKLV